MFGKLTEKEMDALLNNQVIGRIGCTYNNATYVVPISFAYDGQFIYGHTHEGQKIDIMRKNPAVCFEADELVDMANWKSVICMAEFEELVNEKERGEALQILLKRPLPYITSKTVQLSPHWPFFPPDMNLIEGVVYRLLIKSKTGRFEKNDTYSCYAS
jgi:nitroimidazol reductase NimA-like FMN-containing flavoprotein (pyridoxamine 5'-phosphate oxidase superfamily)